LSFCEHRLVTLAKSFKVIQNGANTSYKETNPVTRQPKKVNSVNRFGANGRFTPKPEAESATPKRSLFRSWTQHCPCQSPATEPSLLIEAPDEHFNCTKCGAMAFKLVEQTRGKSETQTVFVSAQLCQSLEGQELNSQVAPCRLWNSLNTDLAVKSHLNWLCNSCKSARKR